MGRLSDAAMGGDLFDSTLSRVTRDEALDRVSSNNSQWLNDVIDLITSLPSGWLGTGEDIRKLAERLQSPKHPNAWGAAINTAIRRKLLAKTGRRVKMKSVRSHARQTDEYRRT